jgi:hypothetical protein
VPRALPPPPPSHRGHFARVDSNAARTGCGRRTHTPAPDLPAPEPLSLCMFWRIVLEGVLCKSSRSQNWAILQGVLIEVAPGKPHRRLGEYAFKGEWPVHSTDQFGVGSTVLARSVRTHETRRRYGELPLLLIDHDELKPLHPDEHPNDPSVGTGTAPPLQRHPTQLPRVSVHRHSDEAAPKTAPTPEERIGEAEAATRKARADFMRAQVRHEDALSSRLPKTLTGTEPADAIAAAAESVRVARARKEHAAEQETVVRADAAEATERGRAAAASKVAKAREASRARHTRNLIGKQSTRVVERQRASLLNMLLRAPGPPAPTPVPMEDPVAAAARYDEQGARHLAEENTILCDMAENAGELNPEMDEWHERSIDHILGSGSPPGRRPPEFRARPMDTPAAPMEDPVAASAAPTAAAAAAAAADVLEAGTAVLYIDSFSGALLEATVRTVHHDGGVLPYYSITLHSTGAVRDTVRERLQRAAA